MERAQNFDSQTHVERLNQTSRTDLSRKSLSCIFWATLYYKKVLEKNEPKEEMKKMFEVIEKLKEERLSEKDGEGFEATKEV